MNDDSIPAGRGRGPAGSDSKGPGPAARHDAAPASARPPARRSFLLRSGAGTALVLLGFIMLPSIVLGYLSWRANENERSYSLERLRASYRQLAILSARQIDYQLSGLESRWIGEFDELLAISERRLTPERVREFEGRQPLIAHYFLLAAPGRVLYPPRLKNAEVATPDALTLAPGPPEDQPFARMVARGEDLEYGTGDLRAAIAAYREIPRRVASPRLQAVAESYVGRAQLKAADWKGALATFRGLLDRYPEVRDLNRMYLRFLAQYQTAVALDGMGRQPEALQALLELNRDLLRRSDAITTPQYSYYMDLIQELVPRLLAASPQEIRDRYEGVFRAFGEQSKKRISERYFIQLLDDELSEMTFRQKRYSPRIRYMTARAEGVPFLLAYRALPDAQETYATGILAAEIALPALQDALFAAMRDLPSGSNDALAILESGGSVVIGADAAAGTLMASQALAPPFGSWQVAIYLRDVPGAIRRLDLRHTLWMWLISLMLLSILVGGYLFILRARRQALLSRAQTTFVSNVTHELRTPLASIRMFAELLELQLPDTPAASGTRVRGTAAQYLAIIRQECDRLNRLVERVLEFSRMERGLSQYRFEPHDIGAIVRKTVESFRPYAEAKGFTLQLRIEAPPTPVSLDADAIAQVLLNLLTNAVQFSTETKDLEVRVGRQGASVTIDVTDRGVGIEPRNLGRVFDTFYSTWRRMDDRTQGGLGLGLTLSREIARAHGGDITVRSEVGHGSTFTVTLPALVPAGVVELPAHPAPEARAVERLGGQRG